jgi:hypothetical protein
MRNLKSGNVGKRRRTAIASLLAIGAFSVAAIAQADNVQVNDIVAGSSATKAPGDSGTATVRMVATNSPNGDVGGCNVGGPSDGVTATVTLTSSQPWLTINSPGSVTLDDCGNPGLLTIGYSVSGTAPDGGVATVSTSTTGGLAGSLYSVGTFTVTVDAPTVTDGDGDGVPDSSDNCPNAANPDQADADGDGIGNVCDSNAYAPALSSAAADASGNEGGTLTTSGAFSDQDGNGTLTITKVSGDGTVTDNGNGTWSWSHPTSDNGSGTVKVKASDGEHTDATDEFNWSAANVAPTASITGAPTTSPEGTQISLGSSVTDPSSVDTSAGFTRSWSVTKNGVAYGSGGSGESFSFTPNDEGTYVVSFSAKDKDDGEGTDSKTITVTNVAPSNVTASFGPALSCTAAANATLSWSFADPGSDTWNAQIDWNYDGTTFAPDETKTNVAKSDSATHSYGSAGTHVAAIRISDGDGGSSNVQTATLTVNYNLSSILQPVNDTRNGQQTSLFKYGSTVPVKVEITDCDGSHPSNLDVRVTYAKTASNPPPVGSDEAVATNAPDGGNQMRFSDPIYIFNFGTKYIGDPTATVRIDVSIPTTGQYTFAHIGLKAK